MTNHTKEPWSIDSYGCTTAKSVNEWHGSITVTGFALSNSSVAKENSRRIVACVNACKGLPTQELEELGIVGAVGRELIELDKELAAVKAECDALNAERDTLKAERDELLSALKMARQDIENTRNIFLTYSLDQKFYDNMATYDNLISKYGEKDNDN